MNEEVNIRLLTLNGCDYCTWLKSELDNEGIEYVNIDADVFSEFTESVETLYQTNHYPVVFIEYKDKVVALLSETRLEPSDNVRIFNTIPELIGMIKQYKNEI
jgi:glutaredoxin